MGKARKTEVYKILISEKQMERGSTDYILKELKSKIILEDFFNYFYNKETNKTHTLKSKNMCYYIDNVEKEDNIRKILVKYIKFNKRIKIVDVKTLKANYQKGKNEGDEEKQHYLIKIFKNTNRAVLIFEKVVGAVTIGILERNINKIYREWIKENRQSEKDILLKYYINIEIVPSPEFIDELMKMDRISLVKVIVDKEKLTNDEDILFSEENISRDEVEVSYKPIQNLSFSKQKVKKYYKNFQNQNCKNKISRMVIQGRKDKNAIRLDTECMKLSEYIDTKLDVDGLVDTNDILTKYTELVNKNFKEYFNNIFVDVDESEE
ncbi:hypothetical protein [Clostridium botulinum]|uniref:hypothetical protein n=1 Tax=Clostridium botulinum TaxID=1491 RepID=UPI001F39A216|nr:hypothetical protein [Clostridium botulinum]